MQTPPSDQGNVWCKRRTHHTASLLVSTAQHQESSSAASSKHLIRRFKEIQFPQEVAEDPGQEGRAPRNRSSPNAFVRAYLLTLNFPKSFSLQCAVTVVRDRHFINVLRSSRSPQTTENSVAMSQSHLWIHPRTVTSGFCTHPAGTEKFLVALELRKFFRA